MAVESATAGDSSPYPALFREYVLRSAQKNLSALQSEEAKYEWSLLERAVHSLGYALELDSGWPTSRDLLLLLSPELERTGLRDEWIPYLQRGIEQSTAREEWATAAELLLQLGLLHQLVGEYEKAETHIRKAELFFEKANDVPAQYRAKLRIAFIIYLKDDYKRAVELATEALQSLPLGHAERANAFRILGHVAKNSEDMLGAVNHFSNALSIHEAAGEQRNIARCLRDIGPALFEVGRVDDALRVQFRALQIFDDLGDSLQRAVTEMNIGVMYHLDGDIDKALLHYWSAEPKLSELNDLLHLAYVCGNIGDALKAQKKWCDAEKYFRTSVQYWMRIGNIRQAIDMLLELSQVCWRQGSFARTEEVVVEAQGLLLQCQCSEEQREKIQVTIDQQLSNFSNVH